jgi:hypothetical protein
MKHAGKDALDRLEPFLKQLRERDGIKEKSRGNFYRASRAFLHFHEHGTNEFYADIRLAGTEFERLSASKAEQRKQLLRLIDNALADGKVRRSR